MKASLRIHCRESQKTWVVGRENKPPLRKGALSWGFSFCDKYHDQLVKERVYFSLKQNKSITEGGQGKTSGQGP